MNKIIQAKLKNSKIIFIAVICILIIGIAGLLIFNATDNSSAKLDNKGNIASKISNNVKEKDKQNEKEDSKGAIEEEDKDSEDTLVISKNGLNISKKSDVSVNSGKKSDDESPSQHQPEELSSPFLNLLYTFFFLTSAADVWHFHL